MVQFVQEFVRQRPRLRLSHDRAGNLLIELPSRRRGPRWVFAAHMDHPGFVARRMLDRHTLGADFHGWVHIDYVRNTKVRFFDEGREIAGRVIEAGSSTHDRLEVPDQVKVRVKSKVTAGSPGMFDQGVARAKGKKLYSRGIDDQGGVAAALAMLDELHKKPPVTPVAVLLTRAEEDGFIGAIAAVLKPKLLRKDDRIVAIECSAEQPVAQQGKGVVIRVGDKTSIFNSALTYFLSQQAEELGRSDKCFKWQRALMPGGTCEATVYDIYGYLAAAVCIPLGNYHNMDRMRKKIGPEYINLDDWHNMVKLFVALARRGHAFDAGHKALRKRVEKRFKRLQNYLATPV